MKRIDVLNLEWTCTASRDRTAASLVCNYLRLQGASVVEGSIFEGYHLINKYSPKVVFMTNTIGAVINHEVIKYAKRRNIFCVSLISEGNIFGDEKYVAQMIWGWNKDKILYEDYQLQWTKRTYDLTIKQHPELAERIFVSGAVGFDLYKIQKYDSKNIFLQKYQKSKFSKVVGVAGWAFNLFYEDSNNFEVYEKIYSYKDIERFRKDHIEFNRILSDVMKKNPDTLFILKGHPGATDSNSTGFDGLINLSNSIYITDQEDISTCISVSDIWLVYDSTTMLEAWLCGKKTAMINPNGSDFLRDDLYRGNPNLVNSDKIHDALSSFFQGLPFHEFNKLLDIRNKLVEEVIQWDDGLNHVRAGNFILNKLESEDFKVLKEVIEDKKKRLSRKIKNLFLKILYKLTKKRKFKRSFDPSDVELYAKELFELQSSYYKKSSKSRENLLTLKVLPR